MQTSILLLKSIFWIPGGYHVIKNKNQWPLRFCRSFVPDVKHQEANIKLKEGSVY